MTSTPHDLLTLSVQLPSRWAAGESRLVKLRLRNLSAVDLKQVRLRPTWSGAERAAELWRQAGNLRRGAAAEHALQIPPPPGREDQFQVEVQAEVGGFLHLELWSEKVDVTARPRPGGDGGISVVIKDSGIGEKAGFGQILPEGGTGVGHVVNVHGASPVREFEQWLADDPAAGQFRELPLYIAQEVCQPWTSHGGLALCGVPGGEFIMGASPDDAEAAPEEKIRREVCLTRSFWMGQHPVTMAEYARVAGAPPPVTLAGHKGDAFPAACITWAEAMGFCEELTRQERSAGALPPGYAYRLPTEAEWEYACRAGSTAPRHGPLEKIGAVLKNHGGMGAVGRYEPNAWGLHDMLGLVFEWCLDAYGPCKRLETTDPVRREPEPGQPLKRVIRGGCYQGPDEFARASARLGREPGESSHRIGFRVVLARE